MNVIITNINYSPSKVSSSFCGQKYSSMNKLSALWSELVRFPVKKVFKRSPIRETLV